MIVFHGGLIIVISEVLETLWKGKIQRHRSGDGGEEAVTIRWWRSETISFCFYVFINSGVSPAEPQDSGYLILVLAQYHPVFGLRWGASALLWPCLLQTEKDHTVACFTEGICSALWKWCMTKFLQKAERDPSMIVTLHHKVQMSSQSKIKTKSWLRSTDCDST